MCSILIAHDFKPVMNKTRGGISDTHNQASPMGLGEGAVVSLAHSGSPANQKHWGEPEGAHSFQGSSVEMCEILVQSPYGQYKMCTDSTGQNE